MDASVIAAIIAVLGTGFLAMLGFFLRGIRSDITALRAEIAALRAEVARLGQSVARLEGTVAEHGRQMERFAGYGERIVALETAVLPTA